MELSLPPLRYALYAAAVSMSALLLHACESAPDSASTTAPVNNLSAAYPENRGCELPTQAPPPTASTSEFSQFAWQQFVALNWPASTQRGKPDCQRSIGASGPTVWETFKTTDQLFLPGAADPGPWQSGPLTEFTLDHRAKADPSLPVEESIRQAVGGWLIDQQGNPTYYSISVNQVSYEYITGHHFYNANVVSQASSIRFPDYAMEIKAAWRILTDQDDPSRFHKIQAQVTVYDDQGESTGQTRPAQVGLVGLHIVYKAPGFPQWVWATFEQVDNTEPNAHGKASYYNEHCQGPYCTPNVSPEKTGQPFTSPNQINRVTPVVPEVSTVNTRWRSKLSGTPFQYYRLIAPQWPSDPQDPGDPQGTPTPGTVANTVMESYIQPTSSCMDCHSTARVPGGRVKSDYSFTFLFAQPPSGQSRDTSREGAQP